MDTKFCNTCHTWKSVDDFHFRNAVKGTRQTHCKSCRKEVDAAFWQKKAAEYIPKKRERKALVRADIREIKSLLVCELCGENTIECLDFHHRDPDQKERSIANAANRGWSVERIQKEMAKCSVLCANCHRKLHAGLVSLPDSDGVRSNW